jgi:YD repeat-containing protein
MMYDSAADEGWLGHGFTVTDFSSIARCSKNLRQDGDIEAASDVERDALCLDGRRLVPVDPASDKPLEFRTLPDTHTKIVAEYEPGWDPARGPTLFRAYSKGGLILEYGRKDSGLVLSKAGVVRAWLKTAVRDRSGNWIAYTYHNDKDPAEGYTVEHAPLRIDYTGHELAPPSRAVVFEYSKREKVDTRVLFARGMALKRSLLLKKIRMLGPGDALVREYKFAFTNGPSTKRTLLDHVEECAVDTICKLATRFTWHHGTGTGFVSTPTPIEHPKSERASAMLADVTGDGLDDLIVGDVDMTGGSEQPITNFIVAPNKSQEVTPSFFDTSLLAHPITHYDPPLPLQPDRGTPLDYDHNGLADIFLHDVHGQFTTWRVLLAKPDHTFEMLDTGLSRPYPFGAAPPLNLATWDASAHLADVSGDGMPDLLGCIYNGVNHAWAVHFWGPDGPGFEKASTAIPELDAHPCNAELHTIDIDIDGKTDLLVHTVTETANGPIFGTTYDALSFKHSTGSWVKMGTELPITPAGGRLIFLDANGDALPDAIETGFDDNQPRTFFNTGRGFREAVLSLPAAVIEADKFAKLAAPIDWNADGRQDLLIPFPNPSGTPSWKILQSTGSIEDGTFTIKESLIPFEAQVLDETVKLAAPVGPRVTDVDGDGIQDVILSLSGQFHVFKNKLFEEDVLATITDGLHALEPNEQGFLPNVQITYDHLIDRAKTVSDAGGVPNVPAAARTYLPRDHAPEGACAYPIRCVVGPRRVVSGYQLNTGKDKPRSFQVAYRNGRFDRLGGRSLGFGMRIVRDLDTGSGTAELFDNETFDPNLNVFPFVGLVEHEWRWSSTLTRPESPPEMTLELLFTHTYRQAIPTTGGQTYFARLAGERKRREQAVLPPLEPFEIEEQVREIAENETADVLSDTKRIVPDFDLYGNHVEELLFTEGADSELLIKRSFENDDGAWLIGQLTKQTECSTVAKMTQCRKVERGFDDLGRLKREEASGEYNDPDTELVVKFVRDDFGNVRLLTRADGFGNQRVECTTFDAEGIYPYAHTNAAGHTSYMRFDKHLGELEVLVDPNGLITKWAYDGFGRLTKELRPDGKATTFALTRTKDGGPQQNAWNLKLRTITLGIEDDTVELDPLGRPVRWWTQGVEINGKPA